MLSLAKVWENNSVRIILTGELDESVNLFELLGSLPEKFSLQTRGIYRVNSAGLKNWLNFFAKAKESGVEIRYLECSCAITNHLSTILSQGARGTVVSVMAPFLCNSCGKEFEASIRTPDITAIKPQITGQSCPVCKGPATFDEFPQEYFMFLLNG